mmetsp:Transcript_17019/g.25309  ORF Transcript_17019/g.25309 Transcript_17019/m.25309 type:complete len:89 (-) Transcript_17019:26-292(-)
MEERSNEVASAVTMPTSTTGNDISGVHVQSTVKQLKQESTSEVNNNNHEQQQQQQQEDISTEVQIAAWKQDLAAIEAREQEIKREQNS